MLTLLALAVPVRAGAQQTVTLDEAVAAALARNPRIQRAGHAVDAARAARLSVRGRLGPVLRVDGSATRWSEPLDVMIPLPEVPGFEFDSDPLRVRDRDTQQLSATLVQPLTGAATAWFGHQAALGGERAARGNLGTERQALALDVTRAYLGALQSEALEAVAGTSVEQIQAHTRRIDALMAGGMAQRGDLLEAQARLAEAQAGLLEARSAARLARLALATHMGLGAGAQVRPAPVRLEPPPPPPEADVPRRPELEGAAARAEQAAHAARATWVGLAPQVDALARYQRSWGATLAGGEEAFVGATVSWNVWEWGASWYAAREADARAAEARAGLAALRDGLALQAAEARSQVTLAGEKLTVGAQAIEAAEENLRLAERRFEAGAATSTDVLDAQALLARARGRLTASRYELLSALANLRWALGLKPILALEGDLRAH